MDDGSVSTPEWHELKPRLALGAARPRAALGAFGRYCKKPHFETQRQRVSSR
jgi:hypothetical protein